MQRSDVTSHTLIALLLDDKTRRVLLAELNKEQGTKLPMHHAFEKAARYAEATPEAVRDVIETLLEEQDGERWARQFVFHTRVPEALLLSLCEQGLCVEALGHLQGPRHVLERVVALHRYPEAIITLALDLYRDADVPVEVFAAHVEAHSDVTWMLTSLARVQSTDAAKAEVVRRCCEASPDFREAAARAEAWRVRKSR
jgi:hypothetical protein